jgi:CRP-like cAMP-binding protein
MTTLEELFKHLAPADLPEVVRRFEPNEHPAGHVLTTEGEDADSLLWLQRGRVQLSSAGLDLKVLEPGNLLGEISLFGHGTRTVTAVALEPVVYHRLRRTSYEQLRDAHHPAAWELEKRACRALASRLHELATEIADRARGSALVEIVVGPLNVGRPLPSTPGKVATTLSRIPGFENADPTWLAAMAPEFTVRNWQPGDHLSTLGHGPMGLVLIASGEIERFAATEATRGVRLAVWGAGAMAGLATLIDPRPIQGFVIATSPVTALVAQPSTFHRWFTADSDYGSHFRTAVIRELGNQVTNANATQSVLHLLGR